MDTLNNEWLREVEREIITHFRPELLGRDRTIFNFEFNNEEPFHLIVQGNTFSFTKGMHNSPTIRLYVSNRQTLRRLLIGSADGMNAFMQDKYRADGNIVLSQLLLYLFKADHPHISHEATS